MTCPIAQRWLRSLLVLNQVLLLSVRVMCDQMEGEFYQNMAEVEGSCALGGYDEEFVDDIEGEGF